MCLEFYQILSKLFLRKPLMPLLINRFCYAFNKFTVSVTGLFNVQSKLNLSDKDIFRLNLLIEI